LAGTATNNAYTDDVIVVTGTRTGSDTPEDYDAPFGFGDDEEGGNDADSERKHTDCATDALADQIARDIRNQPDYQTREYGAVIYRDSNGELQTTQLIPGDENSVPDLPMVMAEIGAENIVAVVHNHPNDNPRWSSNDQQNIFWVVNYNGDADDAVVRTYIVTSIGVREYTASSHGDNYKDHCTTENPV